MNSKKVRKTQTPATVQDNFDGTWTLTVGYEAYASGSWRNITRLVPNQYKTFVISESPSLKHTHNQAGALSKSYLAKVNEVAGEDASEKDIVAAVKAISKEQ